MSARASGPRRTGLTARKAFGVGRIVLAAAGIVGLVGNFGYTLGFATFVTSNFFSYFTTQSAIAMVVMFVLAAVIAFRRAQDPSWLDTFRALVTTYIIVSGIVYAIIVVQASTRDYTLEVPWSNQLLHFWIPTCALLDWLFDPGKTRLPWRTLGWALIYPVLWFVYTLIRSPLVGWYPYFFLDARQVSLTETVLYCAICVALITGIAALLTGTSRLGPVHWWLRREGSPD